MKPAGSKRLSAFLVNGALALICIMWTIPTFGVLVSSFRTRQDILSTGWWSILPHRAWQQVEEVRPPTDLDRSGVMEIAGAKATWEEFRQGVETPDGKRVVWIGNRRTGFVRVQERNWTVNANFSLENYQAVVGGKE